MTPELFLREFGELAENPGGVQRLRDLVLDLAIRGQLEEASKRVLRAGALTEIPKKWQVEALGDFAQIIRGITFPASAKTREPSPGHVACLRTTNVQRTIEWHDLLYVPEKFVSRPEQWVRPGDLCISMANSYELVGKVAQVTETPPKVTFGGFLGIIRPDERAFPAYLTLFMRSSTVQTELRKGATQTTNIANISLGKLRPLPVSIPSLDEQKRIIAKVDQLLALCDELEAKQKKKRETAVRVNKASLSAVVSAPSGSALKDAWKRVADHFEVLYDLPENVKELRQTILQLAVMGKLVKQDPADEPAGSLLERSVAEIRKHQGKRYQDLQPAESDIVPFQVPSGWSWARIGELTWRVEYGTSQKAHTESHGIPILRMGNIVGGALDYGNLKYVPKSTEGIDDLILAPGDLIFNRTNSYEQVGKMAVFWERERSFTFASYLIRLSLTPDILPDYVSAYFETPVCRKTQIEPEITVQTNQANFNGTKLKSVLVPLPPSSEQQRIMVEIKRFTELCDSLGAKISSSGDNCERLMQAVVERLVA